MATSREVRQLVQILDEEGFGSLAGEILAEINLGRELDEDANGEATVVRQPIPEDEQLGDAIGILRLRLVEPVRAFGEAEQIAGNILDRPALRIRFVDPDGFNEQEPISRADPGDSRIAEKLDDFLKRLPRMTGPDKDG